MNLKSSRDVITLIEKQANRCSMYRIDSLSPYAFYYIVTLQQSQISLHPLDPYNSTNSSSCH